MRDMSPATRSDETFEISDDGKRENEESYVETNEIDSSGETGLEGRDIE